MRKHFFRYGTGIGLGLIALFINLLCSGQGQAVERYYSALIFPLVKGIQTYTFGLLPFSSFYLVVFAVLTLLFLCIRRLRKEKLSRWRFLMHIILSILSLLGTLLFIFYMMWGLNYHRPEVSERLNIDRDSIAINLDSLKSEFAITTNRLVNCDYVLTSPERPLDLVGVLDPSVRKVLIAFDYPTLRRTRVRTMFPEGFLLRIGTAGFYNPITGEGNYDPGMYQVQHPSVIAHEMFHGYGVPDEGDCNFMAYLACIYSGNAFAEYSGILSYWRYLAGAVSRSDNEFFRAQYAKLPEVILTDLRLIREHQDRYPDVFPKLRNRIYDSYLKTHGIHEGLVSYGRMVSLVYYWHRIREEPREAPR